MILSRWDRRESGGSNYDKCCFHVPKPWLVETLLNAFLQGATVQEKKRWADPYYLITITVLSLPSSFCEITLTFFALSSSSSFASGKSTFLPLPFFRTVDIVNARDSSTTAQVKKHSFYPWIIHPMPSPVYSRPLYDYDEGESLSPPNVTRSIFKIYSPGYYVNVRTSFLTKNCGEIRFYKNFQHLNSTNWHFTKCSSKCFLRFNRIMCVESVVFNHSLFPFITIKYTLYFSDWYASRI